MKEDELRLLRVELDEMRKSYYEMRVKLKKREWECDSRTMERDQLRANVEKLRLRLNRSVVCSDVICVFAERHRIE